MNTSKSTIQNRAARWYSFVAAAVFGLTISTTSLQAQEARIISGGDTATSKSMTLPLNKAAIIELPDAAADVLVSDPAKVEVVIRSPRRVYLLGMEVGQANAFFFDARNRQILNLEIVVERDVDALANLYSRLMPDSRITIEAVNENVILKGSVGTEAELARAQSVAARFTGDPELVLNMLSVREQNQVMLKVRIVEMQRNLVKQLGVNGNFFAQLDGNLFSGNWANRLPFSGEASGGISGSLDTSGFGDLTDLDLTLAAFESTGLIRTLAEPTLTSVSGEGANFLAGGEFPVPVNSDLGEVGIEFKRFGVALGFRPVVLSRGRINLKINTEVSEVDTTNGFTLSASSGIDPETGELIPNAFLIPGLTVRRVENVVELPSGGSMAIAGLLQDNIRSAVDGVPALKDTPVLGQLFRSNEFRSNQTELVIIVTPYLVEPAHRSELTDPSQGFVHATQVQQLLVGKLESTYGMRRKTTGSSTLQGPLGFILD
ncbi:MAG: type II and III secretion system protein family protein [Aquisalinus sp.]|nr:type II and III secretion system protein family protein [Aquisalinus sp.]